MPVPDLFAEGLARGWKIQRLAPGRRPGAGGRRGRGRHRRRRRTTAEILSAAGLKVLLVEEAR